MDPILWLSQGLLYALGAFGVASSDSLGGPDYLFKHLINIGLAIAVTLAVSFTKPAWVIRIARPLFALTLVLLVLVLVVNGGSLNMRRWLDIPGLPFGFQPSELAKVAVVFYLAAFFDNKPRDYPILGPIVAVTLAAGLIVMADFDTGIFLLVLAGFVLVAIGVPWRRLGAIGLSAFMIILAFSGFIVERFERSAYVQERFENWLSYLRGDLVTASGSLGEGVFQVAQGHRLMLKAGLFGQGVGEPMPHRLPLSQNDMIFASVVWAGGWMAGLMVLIGFWLLMARGLQIAANSHGSYSVMAVGLVGYLVLQAASNIGVAIGILPVSGSPLPLVSYGGSSMVMNAVAMGMLHALSKEALANEAPPKKQRAKAQG